MKYPLSTECIFFSFSLFLLVFADQTSRTQKMSRSKKILTLLNISLDEKDVNKKDEAFKSPINIQSDIVIDQGKSNFYVDPASGILVYSDENGDDIEDVNNEEAVELLPASNKTFEENCNVNPVLVTYCNETASKTSSTHTENSLSLTKNIEENHSEVAIVDNRELNVSVSKLHCKRYFCLYCNKLITNFGRHLLSMHKDQKEVQDILLLPIGHPERHLRIAKLRKEAQFKHNTQSDVNTGTVIVKRRPSEKKNRMASHYIPCFNCKEMFSKLSLRAHVAKCKPDTRVSGERNVLLQSKMMLMNMNTKANPRLAKYVLSRCRDDPITSVILYDDLCILYGNKLTKKYRGDQDTSMIRSRLREIGRFILEFRQINGSVKCLRDILDPNNYDDIVQAVNNVAGLDNNYGRYKAPSTAYNLGLHIKSVASLLETEYIKEKNVEKRQHVRDLLCLIQDGFKTDINRTVSENQTEHKRHKKIRIPTKEDITALKKFLNEGCRKAYQSLKEAFSKKDWKNLAGHTLILMQLFNRRRAGELERILIEDYKSYEFVNEQDENFKNLSTDERNVAKYYARFFIRGKLNRQVAVIISKEFIKYIDMLLKHRNNYGVANTNPYIFGTPGKTHHTYLRACVLMRTYSKACGAPNPDTLRGTELRKQIATACAIYNLSDPLVEDVANHLGHHIDIHKRIYRQSTAREVPTVVQILLKALGEDTEENCDESENNMDSEETGFSTEVTSQTEENIIINSTQNNSSYSPCENGQARVSWSTPEKNIVKENFGYMIETGIVPTYAECTEVMEQNPCLKTRTPPQIKSFVAYETKKLRCPKTTKKGKTTWSTPERQVVRNNFEEYLQNKRLPSLQKCKQVISCNPVLNKRTPEMLKAFINNLINKSKKQITRANQI